MPRRILAQFLEGYSAGLLAGHLAEIVARAVSPEFAQGFEDAVCGLSRELLDSSEQSG